AGCGFRTVGGGRVRERELGARGRGDPARRRRDGSGRLRRLGVVLLGGQLQCRRQLQRRRGPQPGRAAERERGGVGGGGRGDPPRRRRDGPGRQPPLGVVRLGGQLQRRRRLPRRRGPSAGRAAERERGDVGGGGRGDPSCRRRDE